MRSFAGDLRYAVRALRRTPLSTTLAVLTLALGLGVFCTVFGIFEGILLRPLPYEQPDRLVKIWETFSREPGVPFRSSEVLLVHLREESQASRGSGYTLSRANLTGLQQPEQIWIARVSPDLFPLLGVKPLQGRSSPPTKNSRPRAGRRARRRGLAPPVRR